ncbi:MAG: DNA-binding protein [Alphaproteobacteria bacterium]|nr:DNA-binding protein [Alphaproteobacteria bacterium]
MHIRHLNQAELARRWALNHRTLERWRWMGCGPRYLKIGGRVVYRLADIETYEAAQLRNATNAAPASGLRPRGRA